MEINLCAPHTDALTYIKHAHAGTQTFASYTHAKLQTKIFRETFSK